jgi:hypothetical protein
MFIDRYLFNVVGERPERIRSLHASTIRRIKASALAIHIPVLLWGVSGFVLAHRVFGVAPPLACGVAAFCALVVYLVERLVLATPANWYVNAGRVAIGVMIAVLGASAVDLVLFEREVNAQLRRTGETRLEAEIGEAIAKQAQRVEQAKQDWLRAREAANCEANGTCGSRVRNVGPVYRELALQAQALRGDYDRAQQALDGLVAARQEALEEWRTSPEVVAQAGLLARVEALHQYTLENRGAFWVWLMFFLLVLFFESLVVLVKLVSGETVDDRIEMIREQISQQKATAYLDAVTSPVAEARRLIEVAYR